MFKRDEVLQKKTWVFVGAGGVGKTSCSIAFAMFGARMGKKVGLLSIDPARRLASAMGLSWDGEFCEVQLKDVAGSLSVGMLDQKLVFAEMVAQHSPSKKVAKKIMSHPLYETATTRLAGAIEYMALAKIAQMEKVFDWVVIDTPPDTHALEFLNKPNILGGFIENKVMGWMIKPFHFAGKFGLHTIMSFGGKFMGGLSKITGIQALSRVTEFLVLLQDVIQGFHEAGVATHSILKAKTTGFILVGVPQKASARSVAFFGKRLKEMGFHLDGVILNRTMLEAERMKWCGKDPEKIVDPLEASTCYRGQVEQAIIERFAKQDIKMGLVPLFEGDMHTLDKIEEFSKVFEGRLFGENFGTDI